MTTKPKTPLIALQGGLVLSALRKKKKMSDDPFAWYPFAAESNPMPDAVQGANPPSRNPKGDDEVDNVSMSGDSVPDHDLHPRIVLPPGLTLDKKSRSSASVVSLGSWEPLDLIDLEPTESEDSEESDDSLAQKEDGDETGANSRKGAKALVSDEAQARLSRVNITYFASHVSVVIVMLSLTFLGAKRSSSVNEPSLVSIRGAVKQSVLPALPGIETPGEGDVDVKTKLSNAVEHVARTGGVILRTVEQQIQAVDTAATLQAIKDGHHTVVTFLLNPSGQKDLPPFELMNFVDSMMLL